VHTSYCPKRPAAEYTAPTDTALEAHAGIIIFAVSASLPEAAADSTPWANAELTAMDRALSSQATAVHSNHRHSSS
jgi:hypothetical protein